jgi:secernin
MGCDMVVALGSASVNAVTIFGNNVHAPHGTTLSVRREFGRAFCPGEILRRGDVEILQARQTCTVLGWQASGMWGYSHGINENRVVAGLATWQSKLAKTDGGLTGSDLVRLALERSHSARHAVDLITDLVTRHGQGHGGGGDNIFLVADPQEAYVLEAAGSYWAWTECCERRAVSDVGLLRQDWQRLSPGLAEDVIARGWWNDDGSKLDFGSLGATPCVGPLPAANRPGSYGDGAALRRWGRASLLLEQQAGHIDESYMRRLLSDHFDGTPLEVDPANPGDGPVPVCQHGAEISTVASFLAPLATDAVPMAWCTFGPPCLSVYLPLFLDGELPDAYSQTEHDSLWHPRRLTDVMTRQSQRWNSWRSTLSQLQARIDQETDDFLAEAEALRARGEHRTVQRQATLFMQNHLEQLEAAYHRLYLPAPRRPVYATVGSFDE